MQPCEQRSETLRQLADSITHAGLRTPFAIALDILHPVDVLSAQCALFIQPLIPMDRWRQYAEALTDESSWQELRRMLSL